LGHFTASKIKMNSNIREKSSDFMIANTPMILSRVSVLISLFSLNYALSVKKEFEELDKSPHILPPAILPEQENPSTNYFIFPELAFPKPVYLM